MCSNNITNDIADRYTGERSYSCETCDLKFTCHSELEQHVTLCSTLDLVTQVIQDRSITPYEEQNQGQLREVLQEKRGKQCPECGKILASRGTFTVHMRLHTGERPYLCHECNRTYACPSSYRKHMINKHRWERPVANKLLKNLPVISAPTSKEPVFSSPTSKKPAVVVPPASEDSTEFLAVPDTSLEALVHSGFGKLINDSDHCAAPLSSPSIAVNSSDNVSPVFTGTVHDFLSLWEADNWVAEAQPVSALPVTVVTNTVDDQVKRSVEMERDEHDFIGTTSNDSAETEVIQTPILLDDSLIDPLTETSYGASLLEEMGEDIDFQVLSDLTGELDEFLREVCRDLFSPTNVDESVPIQSAATHVPSVPVQPSVQPEEPADLSAHSTLHESSASTVRRQVSDHKRSAKPSNLMASDKRKKTRRGQQPSKTSMNCPLCHILLCNKYTLFRHLRKSHNFPHNSRCYACSIPPKYANLFKKYVNLHSRSCSKKLALPPLTPSRPAVLIPKYVVTLKNADDTCFGPVNFTQPAMPTFIQFQCCHKRT